jgi:hypothetical protein
MKNPIAFFPPPPKKKIYIEKSVYEIVEKRKVQLRPKLQFFFFFCSKPQKLHLRFLPLKRGMVWPIKKTGFTGQNQGFLCREPPFTWRPPPGVGRQLLLARGRVEVSPPPASPSPALILATLEDNNRLLYTKHGSAGNTQLSLPPVRGRNGLWTGGNGKWMRGGQKTLSNFRRGTTTCRCH